MLLWLLLAGVGCRAATAPAASEAVPAPLCSDHAGGVGPEPDTACLAAGAAPPAAASAALERDDTSGLLQQQQQHQQQHQQQQRAAAASRHGGGGFLGHDALQHEGLERGAREEEKTEAAGRRGGCRRDRRGVAGLSLAASAGRRDQGPILDATTIKKYVTPLVIPPVMRRARCRRKLRCGPRRAAKYEIAMRRFRQQILPGAHWNDPIWGILEELLPENHTFPSTTVFGYGPTQDPEPDSTELGGSPGLAPAANSQFNYPAYTVENTRFKPTSVDWINNLVMNPWKCNWRKPYGPDCDFIEHIIPVDQSLHWANPGRLPCNPALNKTIDCRPANVTDPELGRPYSGPVPMVVHVHGGHTDPESDGYPEAWCLPAASDIPENFAREGTLVNQYGRITNFRLGVASYRYRNDQPSATLWFHDHTLGMTRNNVYAGPAGFWLIRESSGRETGLVKGKLPGPAPQPGEGLLKTNLPGRKGRDRLREIPILIQDRSFYENGSLFYPTNRAFFEGLHPEQLQIPLIGNPENVSDIAPIWNPEAFFDVMVVNGVSWPVHKVEPDLYRFRLLNGCGSRFLNLELCIVNGTGSPCPLDEDGRPVPPERELSFYQIGAEQSLLPKVVEVSTGFKTALPGNGFIPKRKRPASSPREALLMGPSERADVLVDFRGLKKGTVVRLINTAPDEPFGGFGADVGMADENTTRQVMEFHVVHDTKVGDDATPPERLKLTLPDADDPANRVSRHHRRGDGGAASMLFRRGAKPAVVAERRDLALLEEDSEEICATIEADGTIVWDSLAEPNPEQPGTCRPKSNETGSTNSTPFGPRAVLLGINGSTLGFRRTLWEDPIVTNPKKDTTEVWELWNWSEDSHPIHIHLVKFRVLSRTLFNTTTAVPADEAEPPVPTEAGWKDTVIAYPGQVTKVAATFDIEGLYVWHCHVLEHEDNEMMVPYCVGPKSSAPGCDAVP